MESLKIWTVVVLIFVLSIILPSAILGLLVRNYKNEKSGNVSVDFPDGSYVLGDDTGGLLENTARMNNEQAQELLESLVSNEPGEYEI